MRRLIPVLSLTLLACPLRPKDDDGSPDDAADGNSGSDSISAPTGAEPEPDPAAPRPVAEGEAASCEDELAKVKAALTACQEPQK